MFQHISPPSNSAAENMYGGWELGVPLGAPALRLRLLELTMGASCGAGWV
jgi:hypothetical protein